jgi:dUTPase
MLDTVNVSNFYSIISPQNKGDSGYDIIASSEPSIQGIELDGDGNYLSIDFIEYETNLIIQPQEGYHTYIFPRSSISKYNLVLANSIGLIDNGYRGTLKLRFKYIAQPIDYKIYENNKLCININKNKIYKMKDKIAQLVFGESITPILKEVNEFHDTERNILGFGSTGV